MIRKSGCSILSRAWSKGLTHLEIHPVKIVSQIYDIFEIYYFKRDRVDLRKQTSETLIFEVKKEI